MVLESAAPALPVLVLTGPTGSGKSHWALCLAAVAPIEVVSVDSAQVYRGLDIGSAKPTPDMRRQVSHHLIDICDPAESYSAGRFVSDAVAVIAGIHARGRVPLLVGGTMLYLRALLTGLAPLPQASPGLRAEIDARAARDGWARLHAELGSFDPQAAARIDRRDSQRIQRALEVYYSCGRTISELQRHASPPLAGLRVRRWALAPRERALLHQRLELRFQGMLSAGFLAEVCALRRRGDLTARHGSIRAVGYRQLWAHLEGAYPLGEAINRGIFATRQLARRQLTWLRSDSSLAWLDAQSEHAQASWISDVARELRTCSL